MTATITKDKYYNLAKESIENYRMYQAKLKDFEIRLSYLKFSEPCPDITATKTKITERIKLLTDFITKLDKALETLADLNKNIVIDRSINKLIWGEIALKYHCSVRTAQRKYISGIDTVSRTIFADNLTVIRLQKPAT